MQLAAVGVKGLHHPLAPLVAMYSERAGAVRCEQQRLEALTGIRPRGRPRCRPRSVPNPTRYGNTSCRAPSESRSGRPVPGPRGRPETAPQPGIRVSRELPDAEFALDAVKGGALIIVEREIDQPVLGKDQRLVADRPGRADDSQRGIPVGQRDRMKRCARPCQRYLPGLVPSLRPVSRGAGSASRCVVSEAPLLLEHNSSGHYQTYRAAFRGEFTPST